MTTKHKWSQGGSTIEILNHKYRGLEVLVADAHGFTVARPPAPGLAALFKAVLEDIAPDALLPPAHTQCARCKGLGELASDWGGRITCPDCGSKGRVPV